MHCLTCWIVAYIALVLVLARAHYKARQSGRWPGLDD